MTKEYTPIAITKDQLAAAIVIKENNELETSAVGALWGDALTKSTGLTEADVTNLRQFRQEFAVLYADAAGGKIAEHLIANKEVGLMTALVETPDVNYQVSIAVPDDDLVDAETIAAVRADGISIDVIVELPDALEQIQSSLVALWD